MKNTFKTIILLLILTSTISACRKDAPTDIRDSLVGNYNCEIHKMFYSDYYSGTLYYDSLKGSRIINISKSPADDGLIINGTIYASWDYKDSTVIGYINNTNSDVIYASFYFREGRIFLDSGANIWRAGANLDRVGPWMEYRGPKAH